MARLGRVRWVQLVAAAAAVVAVVAAVAAAAGVCGRSGRWALSARAGWWERDPAGGKPLHAAHALLEPTFAVLLPPCWAMQKPSISSLIIISPHHSEMCIYIYIYIYRRKHRRLKVEMQARRPRTPRLPSCPFEGWARRMLFYYPFWSDFRVFFFLCPLFDRARGVKGGAPCVHQPTAACPVSAGPHAPEVEVPPCVASDSCRPASVAVLGLSLLSLSLSLFLSLFLSLSSTTLSHRLRNTSYA